VRNRSTVLIPLALAAGLGVAGAGLATPAAAAEDECLGVPHITDDYTPFVPVLKNVPLKIPVEVWGVGEPQCSTMTVDVQKRDGTGKTTVTLDRYGGRSMGLYWARAGYHTVAVATGAGDWVMTKVTHEANSMPVNVPFRVTRAA
jgi:hypothetical protein